ncbi:MAG: lysostaphin resistance A-like protein [Muribaculaceae bacterium]
MADIRFNVTPMQRILMLVFTYVVGLVVASILGYVLLRIGGDDRAVAMIRIATVCQDMFMLVLPAVATAVLTCNDAASLLAVNKRPQRPMMVMAIITMVVSAPAMSYIIDLNASMTLPDSLAGLERSLREFEAAASASVELALGPHTIPNLVMSLLIVSILAGFSEELFFRGALQRLLQSLRISPAAAVWIAAAIFSAIHMQFFGFVPRMLLGAFFGYLLLWSGSVWVPIIAHAFNNAMFIILRYVTGEGDVHVGGEGAGVEVAAAISAVLTAVCLYIMWRARLTDKSQEQL